MAQIILAYALMSSFVHGGPYTDMEMASYSEPTVPILPMLKIPPLPIWLAVHREIRTSRRIREVFDFLGTAVPAALSQPSSP